jgi:hypothetical protein
MTWKVGDKWTKEFRENFIKKRTGHPVSKETRDKLRQANLGKKQSESTKIKKARAVSGNKNGGWKGEDVGYIALHKWIARHRGKPSFCESCKTSESKGFEWANISGEYKRDLDDYERLCLSCHRKKDKTGYKSWETRRRKYGKNGRM